MSAVELVTLGCRLNIAESEGIRAMLAMGSDPRPTTVINSCAVTAEAVRHSRQAVRRARRRNPDARIVVTGCAAQLDPAGFAAMAEVDAVIGNAEKSLPANWEFTANTPRVAVSGIAGVRATAPQFANAFGDHARAFVEVQTGCDHRCTFCVIPLARGDSRSAPAGAVIDAIDAQVTAGHAEVVLTGVDLTSYGHDLPGSPTLASLVERILVRVPALRRLRLSSLDSIEIDEPLFELVTGEPRVMPHLHLSLQAGDDMILKRMKRRHSRANAVRIVERLKARRPDIAVGADLIAGFPTESEAMFANTLALVADCDIVFGHVFPFSPRAGTPAARMPQMTREAIKARAARLRQRCAESRAAWLASLAGTRHDLLIEKDGVTGHLGNFAKARLDTPHAPGSIVPVLITGVARDGVLVAAP